MPDFLDVAVEFFVKMPAFGCKFQHFDVLGFYFERRHTHHFAHLYEHPSAILSLPCDENAFDAVELSADDAYAVAFFQVGLFGEECRYGTVVGADGAHEHLHLCIRYHQQAVFCQAGRVALTHTAVLEQKQMGIVFHQLPQQGIPAIDKGKVEGHSLFHPSPPSSYLFHDKACGQKEFEIFGMALPQFMQYVAGFEYLPSAFQHIPLPGVSCRHHFHRFRHLVCAPCFSQERMLMTGWKLSETTIYNIK